MDAITVQPRFCGPPDSGNGGYTCGLLARELSHPIPRTPREMGTPGGGVMECTLRAPVPMNVPLQVERTQAGGLLRHGEKIVVEAKPTTIAIKPPVPISVEAATKAMASSPALDPKHPFPTCFVCGPKRGVHDGLRIFPAPLDGNVHVAAWVPDPEFGDNNQLLRPEFLWAAMDCPTGFAAGFPLAGKLVTGRLAVEQRKDIRTGAECVLMAWPLSVEGRKHFSAACLYQNEELCAVAMATWIRLEGEQAGHS